MPFPKESFYAGKKDSFTLKDKLFYISAIIGSSILIYSMLRLYQPQVGFIIGSSFMLASAIYFRMFFFIALEMILISGHAAILLGIGPSLQLALPILLVFQLVVYYLFTNQLLNLYRIIGLAGISLLSIGFAYESAWIFFYGSLAVSTYAFYSASKGRIPALIWGFLNIIFAVITLTTILL